MANKIAMMGFGQLTMFEVTQNDASGYAAGKGFKLPWVQEMTRETDTNEVKIYADDSIYLDIKNWNGIKATITLAQMPLEMFEKLGFGSMGEGGVLKWNPQGVNKQFALSFRCLRADGSYRMMKMFSFTVNEVKESDLRTKGAGDEIVSYKISGTFTARVKDGCPGEIKDGTDMEWLDAIS